MMSGIYFKTILGGQKDKVSEEEMGKGRPWCESCVGAG